MRKKNKSVTAVATQLTDPNQIRIIDEAIVSLSTEEGTDHLPRFIAVLGTLSIDAVKEFKTRFCLQKPDLDEYLPFIYSEAEEVIEADPISETTGLREWYRTNKAELDSIFVV